MKRVPILNGQFDAVTFGETLEWIKQVIHRGDRGYISTVNVAILMMMRSNELLQRIVEQSGLIVADGQPLVWASRWLSQPLPERVTGVDLVEAIAATAAAEGFGIYLMGAEKATIEKVSNLLKTRYPNLRLCGFDDGYFGPEKAGDRARAIRESGAQILLVGMGVPRQEVFLAEQWASLGVNVALGVGGSFEVLAGHKTRAPRWIQQSGLEWLYRLLQEPRRLMGRYLSTNSAFIYYLLQELVRTKWLSLTLRTTPKAS